MIPEVRPPQLVVIGIDVDPGGIFDKGLRTCENSDRRYIAASRGAEDQNRISHVISDEQLVASRIIGNSCRPIHLSLGALNDTKRGGVSTRGSSVNRNRRRQILAGTGDGVAESQRPVRFSKIALPDSSTGGHSTGANLMDAAVVGDKYEVIFRIQSHSMGARKKGWFPLNHPNGGAFNLSGFSDFNHALSCFTLRRTSLRSSFTAVAKVPFRGVH